MTNLGLGSLLVAILASVIIGAGPAAAAPDGSCEAQIEDALSIESLTAPVGVAVAIATPLPRTRIRGATEVTGTARSTSPLSRVELVVGGSVVSSQRLTPAKSVDFSLPWNTKSANVGHNVLQVFVCGDSVQGASSVEVTVPPRRPVWVGLVAGTAGVAGLLLSSAFGPNALARARRSVMSRIPAR